MIADFVCLGYKWISYLPSLIHFFADNYSLKLLEFNNLGLNLDQIKIKLICHVEH